ncbi:MAG: hypothetical protein KDH94_05585, partial [Coxiellaceae bacterium]|nr:hypothetical protein [Coxiellaceae bacterium]
QNSIDGPSFSFFSSKKATAKVERVSDFIKKNFSDENRSAGAGESLSATVSAASLFSSASQTSDPGNPSDGGSEPSFVVFD